MKRVDRQIRIFDSDSSEYEEAFRTFVSHTDQKIKALEWLNRFVSELPARNVFVDVGAGDGTLTIALKSNFNRSLAIEPNSKFGQRLKSIAGLEVIEKDLRKISGVPPADFVVCSHVFYLLDESLWLALTEQMMSWLSVTGHLVIVGQSKGTDCKKMVAHFYSKQPDLSLLFKKLRSNKEFESRMEKVPSFIITPDQETAYKVAEFILNGKHAAAAPSSSAVREYLNQNCKEDSGGYRLSCHQDFLIVNHQRK